MGKIKQGILGGFSGKVGPVIGTSWKGKSVMRAIALSHNDANSEAQQQQRLKFKLLIQFVSRVNSFIELGFCNRAVGMTAPNAAMHANLDDAITGEWPNYKLDYGKTVVSAGTLDLPYNPTGTLDGNDIAVSWTDNSNLGNAHADDKVMLLAYNSSKDQTLSNTAAAERQDHNITLALPSAWSGDTVEVWMAMRREKDGETSKSVYLGSYTL